MPRTQTDNQNRKKTSISLPVKVRLRWSARCKQFIQKLPSLLSCLHQSQPTRNRFRRYAAKGAQCEIISVYWDMETYNKLHTIAATLRISVSLLITRLLERMDAGVHETPSVLNYAFMLTRWTARHMEFAERLEFFATPPPLTP